MIWVSKMAIFSARRAIAFICTALLFAVSVFAQEDEEQEADLFNTPDSTLQRNFTFIQSAHANDLNPHTASYSSEAQLLTSLFEGLFSYSPSAQTPQPGLAESYRISRNKLRWTFKIRQGAKFSNGTPITAHDVKESWLSLLATPNAPYASLLDVVKGAKDYRNGSGQKESVGISVPDDFTLVVILESPASHLQKLLCHHAFAVVNKDKTVSSGAFVIEKQTKDTLVLKKNENYWDAANVHIPQITVIQSDDTAENTFMFNTGAADWVDGTVDTDKVLNKSAVHIHAEYGTQYLFFKSRLPPWDRADFRNALVAAVPWEEMRKGVLVPAMQLVYPLGDYPRMEELTDTDIYEAIELMKEARQNANIPENEVIPVVFSIIDTKYMRAQAESLAKSWATLGVRLEIKTVPAEEYLLSIPDSDADLFSYTWIGDFADPLSFLELFRGGSTLNPSCWKNKEYDSLLDKALSSSDEDEHIKLLAKAEHILIDEGEILPISHPVSLHIIDTQTVGGWQANALDLHPFKYMYFKPSPVSIPNLVMR